MSAGAWEELENLFEQYAPPDKMEEIDKKMEEWKKRWVLGAEYMARVKKSDVEQGGPVIMAKISANMKDAVFTAIGRDRSLMFHMVRPVGDLYEFRLSLAVLRPVPAPDAPEAPPSPLVAP